MSVTDITEDQQPARPRRRVNSVSRKPRSRAPAAPSQPASASPAAAPGAPPPLADDILRGAVAIAEFLFGESTEKLRYQVYHIAGSKVSPDRRLPTFKLGEAVICARKSTILAWIARQEAEAVSDAENA